jgi:hypothetical protein
MEGGLMSSRAICPECKKDILGHTMMRGMSEIPMIYCCNPTCSRCGVPVQLNAIQNWRTGEITAEKYQSQEVAPKISVLTIVKMMYTPVHPAKILSIHEVCTRTGLNEEQVRYYARTGAIKPRRRGNRGKWQFYQKDIEILNGMINIKRVMPVELGGFIK